MALFRALPHALLAVVSFLAVGIAQADDLKEIPQLAKVQFKMTGLITNVVYKPANQV